MTDSITDLQREYIEAWEAYSLARTRVWQLGKRVRQETTEEILKTQLETDSDFSLEYRINLPRPSDRGPEGP